ncbi:AraC family transcriptional regulator [Chitinophaga sp. S165]|uniref:helix-turn-helix domain-containing protein n=1 Tax=Chitinophaga sp. S165 TaxID=2135462 RepID=UPI000D9B8FBE|nr:AraC family transcriptional regulator [Chitinophaga sp. S165]PWV50612.1 AraC-like DNA-binding protein [Chitinophaga sp. S165]
MDHNASVAEVALSLDGYSLIEQCAHNINENGTMYLEEHLLLFLLEGSLKVIYGKESFQVNRNEMILLKKATLINYESVGNPLNNNLFSCLMFSLKDEMIKSFLTSTDLKIAKQDVDIKDLSSVQPMDDCLIAFAHSLGPFFKNVDKVAPSQLRHKMMELLYDTAVCSDTIFQQILHLQEPVRMDLREVVERHYATPIRIEELAYLSGRSLSSFKREFQQIFNVPPATWIREKRLNKAKEMLETTAMSVSEICYSLGFENVSHFSRIFKQYHGIMPTSLRQDS